MIDIWIIDSIKKGQEDRPAIQLPIDDPFIDPPKQPEETKTEEEERGVWIINPEEEGVE